MTTLKDHKRAELISRLMNAASYVAVFGEHPGITADEVNRIYRNMARLVHPDAGGDTEAFQKLNEFKAEADEMLARGRYGKRAVLATIRTRKATHTVKDKIGSGDIATLYVTDTQRDETVRGVLKVAKTAKDNDLLAAEAKALKQLHGVKDALTRHVPLLLDSFIYHDGRRRANVLPYLQGYTAEELRTSYFLNGLDAVHMVWIFRRLLMGLGFAHDNGVVHGAVVPPHVLIEPVDHKVILLDWCYSSIGTDLKFPPLKAVATNFRSWYPEEVLEKKAPSPATDLYMAAKLGEYLCPDAPKPFRAFFKGCLLTKQTMRPQNAWVLLAEFDDLLRRMGVPYYPRQWREFHVPTGTE